MKDDKNETKRKRLKLVDRFENDDYSKFAAPDYLENNFEIGLRESEQLPLEHRMTSGLSSEEEHVDDKGPYFGYGPKGYRRKDELIYEDVSEMLMRHRGINATDIVVRVHNGTVHLTGKVQTGQMKILSSRIIGHLTGVSQIKNDLEVIRDPGHSRGPVGVTEKDLGLS